MNDQRKGIKIPFHLHPYEFDKKLHAVEKSENEGSLKRRYLKGYSSGMKTDAHGERMTKECLKNMQDQANSGEILLYYQPHGVTQTCDIGRLVESEITPTGEWITTYRLFDEADGFEKGSLTLESADKLWRQINGLPPYETPLQKGFSIEGYIPEGGIIEMSDSGQRVINKVDLDGVIVTPRPAYTDSVTTAVYKALDELLPDKRISVSENIRGKFMNKIAEEEMEQSYFKKRYKLQDALDDSIESLMRNPNAQRDRLEILFQEYSNLMIDLILGHQGYFVRPSDQPDIPEQGAVDVAKERRIDCLKGVYSLMEKYAKIKLERISKSNNSKRRKNNDKPRRKNTD